MPDHRTRSMSWSFAEWPVYLVLAVLALVLATNVEIEKRNALARARVDQSARDRAEARQVAARVESYFDQVYRGLRTIARLPSVRTIDRHAANFHAFARASVQEIYNNLAETAKVSEVYILPVDFEPDAIDRVSGKPQEPIAMFDEFIAGRSADQAAAEVARAGVGGLAEIEIHEYRLMREQIALLKAQYGVVSAIKDLAYPVVMGREVVTCDNSLFSTTHGDDAARMGLVLSMPFYDLDGIMRGTVAAVMLSARIGQLLPSSRYAIVNPNHGLRIAGPPPLSPVAERSPVAVSDAAAVAEAVRLPLNVRDLAAGWSLVSAATNATWDADPDVKAAGDKAFHRHLAILISFAALFSMVRLSAQRHREVRVQNVLLEDRVRERTEALDAARKAAEAASFAKTQFLAHMSHEIRTPMSAVIGTVDLLLRSVTDERTTRHLGSIRNSGQALVALINQMLDLAAVEGGRVALTPALHHLRPLVLDVAQLFEPQAKAKGLLLSTEVGAGVPEMVWIDAGCCRQILINLVANAIKATDAGSIAIRVDLDDEAARPGGRLLFEISDTGRGIPEALGQGLFELKGPGSELQVMCDEGAGLGLPISRLLAEKMGGSIGFRRRQGGGTTFFFTLPLVAIGAGRVEITEPRDEVRNVLEFAGLQVLLVEDNPTLAKLTRELLETAGCVVAVMADGLAAVAELEHTAFDVILMDCRLQGLDGIEVTRLIRGFEAEQGGGGIAIIGVTANAFDWDREACLAAGMNDFVSKPFTADQLFGAIGRTLGARRRRPDVGAA